MSAFNMVWETPRRSGEQPEFQLENDEDGSLRLWANMEFWLDFDVDSARSLRDALNTWIAEQAQ